MSIYTLTTDGLNHLTGKPIRLFGRVGRWWAHVEVGHRAFGIRVR